VLWECGPELAASALRQGGVQQVAAVIAPKLLGGVPARTPLGDLDLRSLSDIEAWEFSYLHELGEDLLCWAVPIQGSGQFGANIATAEPLTAA
jgi:diaminohydroxyphosphoribosylaminopyrimidine deaminase/5-amino-6-(5-phosphoribosylamino)uracil reductase